LAIPEVSFCFALPSLTQFGDSWKFSSTSVCLLLLSLAIPEVFFYFDFPSFTEFGNSRSFLLLRFAFFYWVWRFPKFSSTSLCLLLLSLAIPEVFFYLAFMGPLKLASCCLFAVAVLRTVGSDWRIWLRVLLLLL
jgi:hypothetical protein